MRVPIWLRITAALWAAVFLFIALTLPPARRDADAISDEFYYGGATLQAGAFHIHTTQSDGGGTRDDVARAARASGLQFVILTDHGDGMREPAPPEYLHGVLVIDGVEVTTSAGHYATFGASRSPYPLGGPPYAVIEDVARLGGFGVASHPDSAKVELRWRDWNAAIDGFEWINGDSAWRDESATTVARGLVDYLFRPGPALAGLVERPARLLQRLDDMNRARRVVAIAGADAHARLPLTSDEEPYGSGWTLPAPSYRTSFSAFANIVDTRRRLTGNAAEDAAAIRQAIAAGQVYFAMTSLATPPQLEFVAEQQSADVIHRHATGSRLPAGRPLTFSVRTSDVMESGKSLVRLALLRDGRIVTAVEGPQLSHRVEDARGVWRVEATLAHRPDVPWLLGNPIVIWDDETPAPEPDPAPAASLDITGGAWAVEKQEHSSGTVEAAAQGQRFSYQLAGGPLASQFAAAVRPTANTEAWDTVVFTGRADAPTRLWVQLRLSDSRTGQRWGRSIYLDETPRTYRLPLREFAPLEPRASASRPNVVQVRAVLLVVDTVNSRPGRAGQISIESLQLQRQP